MMSEALVSFEAEETAAEIGLQSAMAFIAAIRGYTESTIGRVLDRRRQATVGDLFDGSDQFGLSMARSSRDLHAAAELVQRQYASRGYFADTDHEQTAAARSIRQSVVLARSGSRVVGTVTVCIDSPAGLFVDEMYRDYADELRSDGRRLGEVVRLAVSHQHETDSRKALASVFNAAHGVMVANRLDDVFIEVNPRHIGFYRRALCFEVVGEERLCPRVNAPSVLLKMRVDDLTRRIDSLERAIARYSLRQIV